MNWKEKNIRDSRIALVISLAMLLVGVFFIVMLVAEDSAVWEAVYGGASLSVGWFSGMYLAARTLSDSDTARATLHELETANNIASAHSYTPADGPNTFDNGVRFAVTRIRNEFEVHR